MEYILKSIWYWLEKLSVIFSLAAAIFSLWALLKIYFQEKKMREIAEGQQIEPKELKTFIDNGAKINTINPMALCLSLLPNSKQISIKPTVEQFLKTAYKREMTTEEIVMDGINESKDMITLVEELKKKRREFESILITELHLFISGPVAAGVIAGSILNNWIPVKIYSPSKEGFLFYDYWMPIPKQF